MKAIAWSIVVLSMVGSAISDPLSGIAFVGFWVLVLAIGSWVSGLKD